MLFVTFKITGLTKFRGTDKVDDEILEMIEESKVEEEFGKVSLLDLITQENFRRKFFPLAVNQIVQQLCGINAVSVDLFTVQSVDNIVLLLLLLAI